MEHVKVFHYTTFNSAPAILGKDPHANHTGLQPRKALGIRPHETGSPNAIYGLLEPTPKSWTQNSQFPQTWEILKGDLALYNDGGLLLEIDVDPAKTRAFVADRGHLEKYLYTQPADMSKEGIHKAKLAAEKAFVDSMVPLGEYQSRNTDELYSLPEVVILDPIPAEQIRISSEQPILEERLGSREFYRNRLISLIKDGWFVGEMKPWLEGYEATHGELVMRDRDKPKTPGEGNVTS